MKLKLVWLTTALSVSALTGTGIVWSANRSNSPQRGNAVATVADSPAKADVAAAPPAGMRPVVETKTKVVNYTVVVPVHETHEKEIQYTVMKPVYETREKTVTYTVCTMVAETKTKTVNYTTCRMVPETRQKTVEYQVVRYEPIEDPQTEVK